MIAQAGTLPRVARLVLAVTNQEGGVVEREILTSARLNSLD